MLRDLGLTSAVSFAVIAGSVLKRVVRPLLPGRALFSRTAYLLRRRWPSRVYQIRRVVSTDYDSKEDIGTVVVQYNYEVSNAVKRKTGQMETFLVFGTVSKEPKVILVTEHNVR